MHVSLLGTSCIFLDINFPGTEMAGKGTTQFMNEKLAEETPMFSKVSTWALKTNLRCTVFVCMFFPFIHSWFLLLSQREYIPFVHFCSEAGDFFTGIFTSTIPPTSLTTVVLKEKFSSVLIKAYHLWMYSFTSDAQNIYLLKTIPECKKSTSSPTFFVLHYKQLITYINKYRYYRMFYSHVKKAPAYSPGYPAPISGIRL